MLPLHKSAIHQTGNLVRQINMKLPSEHLSLQPNWSKRSRIVLTLQAQMHFHDLIHQQTLFTHSIILQLQRYRAINTHSMHVVNKVLTSSMEAMLFVVSRLRSRSSASIHIPSKLTPSVCNAGVAASPLKSITAHFSMPANCSHCHLHRHLLHNLHAP